MSTEKELEDADRREWIRENMERCVDPRVDAMLGYSADRPTRWNAADWEAFDAKLRPEQSSQTPPAQPPGPQ